jgi:hypothetical protein
VYIQHRQNRVRIALDSIRLDRGSYGWLAQYQLTQFMQVKVFCVQLEELREKTLESVVVDVGVGVEKVKIDVDKALGWEYLS